MKKSRVVAIIPARLKSNRLPGKVLMDIQGKTMLQRVHSQAKLCFPDEDVYIATDSEEVKKSAESFGAQVVMTGSYHESGTQRIAEAVKILKMDDDDVVVNVQGDEPEISPVLIQHAANHLLRSPDTDVATFYTEITNEAEFYNPNNVKVVLDRNDNALYFSREPIPHHGFKAGIAKRHVGIYAYHVRTLKEIAKDSHPAIEFSERLEQLQVLYDGGTIRVLKSNSGVQPGIDTQEDLDRVRKVKFD